MKLLNNKGQSLVEFVLVLPIIILLLFGMIDIGLALQKQHIMNQMAKELARFASIGDTLEELEKTNMKFGKLIVDMETASSNEELLMDGTTITKLLITGTDGTTITTVFNPSVSYRIKGNPLEVTINYRYTPITPIIQSFAEIPLTSTIYTHIENTP